MARNSQPLRPTRALLHPLWWAALALLVLNDHLLKGAGVLPAALTGKLSDFAGMLVAPALLAALVGVRGRAGLLAAHAAVGLGFAAINLSPGAAAAVSQLTATTPWPWFITVDPTDLWALPALAVSWRVLGGFMARPVPVGAVLARAGLAVGAWACVATSPPPEDYPDPNVPAPETAVPANIMVVNTLDQPQRVRVRALLPSVSLDCRAVLADPTGSLDAAFFGPAETWEIEPHRALPLVDVQGRAACVVWRLDGPSLPLRDLVIATSTYPTSRWTPETAQASGRAVNIVPAGWEVFSSLYPVGGEPEGLPVPEACAQPDVGAGLNWTLPEAAQVRIYRSTVGTDGCHRIELASPDSFSALTAEPGDEVMYVCTGGLELPFEAGDRLGVIQVSSSQRLQLVLTGQRHTAILTIASQFGGPADGLAEVPLPLADTDCPRVAERCGGVSWPLRLDRGGQRAWRVGQTIETDDAELTLIRADRTPVWDTECMPERVGHDHLEVFTVRREDRPTDPEVDPRDDAAPDAPDGADFDACAFDAIDADAEEF